jgi:serine/threonine-protein kinase
MTAEKTGPGPILQKLTYLIERKISVGGMSQVYEAVQLGVNGFQKRVALKFLSAKLEEHTEILTNFIGEAKLVSDLIHTNIGQIYHLGHHEGRFFIAMEFIDGVTLEQFRLQHDDLGKAVPFEIAVFVVSRVVRGLAYAHEKTDRAGQPLGLVHRDVNPQNVMMSFEGDVKLVDFGVAKANALMADTEGQVIAGKLDYMSPEQIDYARTDFRSDHFSICAVLVELLTGEKLFSSTSIAGARKQISSFQPAQLFAKWPAVFADERLRAIITQAMAHDPARRHGTTKELLVDLERLIYSSGYGPTNETLAEYLRALFPNRSVIRELGPTEPTVIVG